VSRRRALLWLAALGFGVVSCEIIAGLHDHTLDTCDACVDAAPETGPTCIAPSAICATGVGDASACVDLSSDLNHCGVCTNACTVPDAGAFDATTGNPDPGFPFDAGAEASYVSIPGPSCEGGACGLACSSGRALCTDLCYDTNSVHDHCGSCTTACPAAQWCFGGHCCDAGAEDCDGGCIDVTGDSTNCGGCGIACPMSAATCLDGTCTHTVPITTVCSLTNTSGIFCSGNCSNNHAQYADAYCKLAGYTSAVSYTVLTSGSVSCVYYSTQMTVPTMCAQIMTTASYGLNSNCDAIENLVCQ
jgi:hypothetical protein